MATSPFPTGSLFGASAKPPKSSKPTEGELKRYAMGVVAHVAIQTVYRVEHPTSFVVNERSVWVGDPSSSTISQFADLIDRGISLRQTLGRQLPAHFNDISYFLLMMLNDSSMELVTGGGRISYKRFDILDFGRLGAFKASAPSPLFGDAYEIKSENAEEQKKGSRYVTKMTNRFNEVVSKYGKEVGNLLGVANLAAYRLRPGASWPSPNRLIPIGTNVLQFWLSQPGLIAYRWEKFDPRALKRMWELARNASRLVRDAMRKTASVRNEVVLAGAMVAVPTAFVVGIPLIAILDALATYSAAVILLGGRAALATNRVLVSNAALVLSSLGSATAFARPGTGGTAQDDSAAVRGAHAVHDFLMSPNPIDDRLFSSPTAASGARGGEARPGGTAPTEDEQLLDEIVTRLIAEIRFVYAVRVGQGDEDLLNEETQAILDENLRIIIGELIARVGAQALFDLLGIAGPNDEAGIHQAAMDLVGLASEKFNDPITRAFFDTLWLLEDPERDRMVPLEANDDGEAPEPG